MSEEEGLSTAAKLDLVKRIVASSPPGQADLVFNDVRALASEDVVSEEVATDISRQYDLDNTATLKISSLDWPVLLCAEAALEANKYLDSRSKKVINVDPKTKEVGLVEDAPSDLFPSDTEALREALTTSLSAYMMEHFTTDSAVSSFQAICKDGKIEVILSSSAIQLQNQWTGRWLSRYTVHPVTDVEARIEGSTNIVTHYFEFGNVQMRANKTYAAETLSADSNEALARKLVSRVTDWENDLHSALSEMYQSMSNNTLKEMRRNLPISGQKMVWNAHAHRMRKEMRKARGGGGTAT